ncbi:MAG: dihydrofolate reductase family protein [Parasphingorhabdus sp.]|uniref:dihydrofolate reductase family protein n=1 Tax=Parasphingorhabdus sp. TaxID=2709688 RepID=UPI003296F2F0
MQPIIYDVALSIDGFIAGPDGDVTQFAHEGPVVDDYNQRLQNYACAIMGKQTYEFGYRFGMEAGSNPYPHLATYVFSETIMLPEKRAVEIVSGSDPDKLQQIRNEARGPIYLCGGGQFAGSLWAAGMIDIIRLKRAPILLGGGTPLFADADPGPALRCVETKYYDDGYLFQEFHRQN